MRALHWLYQVGLHMAAVIGLAVAFLMLASLMYGLITLRQSLRSSRRGVAPWVRWRQARCRRRFTKDAIREAEARNAQARVDAETERVVEVGCQVGLPEQWAGLADELGQVRRARGGVS